MTIGKLVLCLSIVDGFDPQKRSVQEALSNIDTKKDNIIFIGFSPASQKYLQDIIPSEYLDKFYPDTVYLEKDTLRLICGPSTKVVIFNHLVDKTSPKERIRLIIQLLHAGINVFASASLAFFELCKDELKDLTNSQNKTFFIPASFYKYINRILLINNFNEIANSKNDCDIKQLLANSPEKNLNDRLTNMAFVLATHIHYHNKNYSGDIISKSYNYVAPKNFTSRFLNAFRNLLTLLSNFSQTAKRKTIYMGEGLTHSVIATFCALFLTTITPPNTNILFIFLICAVAVNIVTYSWLPIFLSIVLSISVTLPYITIERLNIYMPLKLASIGLCILLFYLMWKNKRTLLAQKEELKKKETRFKFLHDYSESLATATSVEEIYKISQQYFNSVFNLEIILILQNPHTLKTSQVITPKSNTIIHESELDVSIKQFNLDHYGQYELILLAADSIEFGWIGTKPLQTTEEQNTLDPTLLNSVILQLTIALQRHNLSASYQNAVLSSEKEQLRSVILSSISHDLKTPLTTIIGSCTALEEIENLSEKNKMVLVHTIHEASDQLNQFISNILDSSRLATENILQQSNVVYIDDVINVVLHRSKKILKLFDISVTVANPEEAAIYGDFTLMQQVFYNLIENATKYGPLGGKISIYVHNIMDKVFVRVCDSGPGILPSKRNLVFDKFYRFQQTDQKKAGTGLGLSICKQIIEAFKGKIWVSDRDDGLEGAQFNIELPCAFQKR